MMNHFAIDRESRAISALIGIAPANGDTSPEANQRARNLCADALRGWRKDGRRERAIWFRGHISWIGYPLSRQQFEGSANRHQAWKRRYYSKHPLGQPQGCATTCNDDSGYNG